MKKFILLIVLMLVCGVAQATDYCASAVGCWLFKEGSGTTVEDSSPNTNTGNFKGSGEPAWDTTDVSFHVSGSAPNSVDFDGTDDYIVMPSASVNLNTGSITAWVSFHYAYNSSTPHYIFDTDGARHAFFHADAAETMAMYNDGRQSNFRFTWTQDTFYHFAFLYNKSGTIQELYKDATPIVKYAAGGEWGSNALGTNAHIGSRFNYTENAYAKFTDVATFNTALTSTDISAIYDFGLQPSAIASKTHTFGNITVLSGSGTISF